MRVLITGAAGNLGSLLARLLQGGPLTLRLLIHRRGLPPDLAREDVRRADLEDPSTLRGLCDGVDCIVHFAGILFAPRPEAFLPKTNMLYVRNLVAEALRAKVRRFILISFPHVEGETSPDRPARGRLDGRPDSVHAKTRLAAERHVFRACEGTGMTPVSLRAGMVYGRGILMIEAARWFLRRRLLGIWRRPTVIQLLALPDFLECAAAAISREGVHGIYHLGDDHPVTLQEFLDRMADTCGYGRPWRMPEWLIHLAALGCELGASVIDAPSPLTRDFVKIGMTSYWGDTTRMKSELLPRLAYPRLEDGLSLL
jgi:nucleoside-diphosphate-sugar epimerase